MSTEAKIITTISSMTILVVLAFAFFAGRAPSTQAEIVSQDKLVTSDSQKLWYQNAKVTIVEFGDFQCPSCAQMQPVIDQVEKDYKGKVNLVFRHFPLPQHANAIAGAQAAEAAGAQGKFWQMYDLLYSQQSLWVDSPSPKNEFLSFAKQLGLNLTQFKSDLSNKTYADKIQVDQAAGNALGINATPTFFINGEKVVGVVTYSELKAKIDAKL